MLQVPIINLRNLKPYTITDSDKQAIYLILLTLFTPKYSIPNLEAIGTKLYNLLATTTEMLNYQQIFFADLDETANALDIPDIVKAKARAKINRIEVNDAYIYTDSLGNYYESEVLIDDNRYNYIGFGKIIKIYLDDRVFSQIVFT